ncbi:MAG: response regulator transcription factor [Chloroflexi bacterium]|nr:response regulator transcription factor [Chloroflexota bacterium]
MIADDHDLVRHGLMTLMETVDDIEVIGQARTCQEAIDLTATFRPEVVLMDLVMPDSNGVDAIRILKQRSPESHIIALTSFDAEDLVEGAIQAGAISYLLKSVSTEELVQAIRDAHQGRSTMSQEATQALIRASRRPDAAAFNLTARELDVLALLVRGLTNAQIADELVISRSTAKKHVRSILSKLGTNNRTEAAALAIQNKLVESKETE